jgi:2-dehydropantoate 2-reductase
MVIGNWKRGADEKLEALASILNYVSETRISEEIFQELYSKLIINSCVTTLGAVCGQYLGEMLRKQKSRNLFIAWSKRSNLQAGFSCMQ